MGILIDFEKAHIRLCDYDFWISKKSRNFRLDITESSTNTQSTRKNSMWSQNYLSLTTLTHHWCILVNLPTTFKNSLHFNWVCWLMIIWKCQNLFASRNRQHRSTITCICGVTNIVYYESDDCTRSWSLNIAYFLFLTECKFNKKFFSFRKAISNRLNWFPWETVVFDNLLICCFTYWKTYKLMKVIS